MRQFSTCNKWGKFGKLNSRRFLHSKGELVCVACSKNKFHNLPGINGIKFFEFGKKMGTKFLFLFVWEGKGKEIISIFGI